MPLMSQEVYDALREIGVSNEKATRAAVALALPNRELADLRSDMAVEKWMVGANTTLSLLILGKILFFMP